MKENEIDELMTTTQYAKQKNVSRATVYYWLKNNYLDIVVVAGKKFIKKNCNPTKQLK